MKIHWLQNEDQEELKPTITPGDQIILTILRNLDYNWFSSGYKPSAAKSADEYAKLDAEDESLARWKASLGIVPGSGAPASGSKVSLHDPEFAEIVLIVFVVGHCPYSWIRFSNIATRKKDRIWSI